MRASDANPVGRRENLIAPATPTSTSSKHPILSFRFRHTTRSRRSTISYTMRNICSVVGLEEIRVPSGAEVAESTTMVVGNKSGLFASAALDHHCQIHATMLDITHRPLLRLTGAVKTKCALLTHLTSPCGLIVINMAARSGLLLFKRGSGNELNTVHIGPCFKLQASYTYHTLPCTSRTSTNTYLWPICRQ